MYYHITIGFMNFFCNTDSSGSGLEIYTVAKVVIAARLVKRPAASYGSYYSMW